jgi:hypothetical protein
MWRVLGVGILAWVIQALFSVLGYFLVEWWMDSRSPLGPDLVAGQILALAQLGILPLLAIPLGLAIRIWAERIHDQSYWPDLVCAILMLPILLLPTFHNFAWEWPRFVCALVGASLILLVIRLGLRRRGRSTS